jgi:AcrR family transcriptional regulator
VNDLVPVTPSALPPATDPWAKAMEAAAAIGRAASSVVGFVDDDLRRELATLPLMAATAVGRRHVPIRALPEDGHRPIVFVHGLLGHPGNFRPLARYLRNQGHSRLYGIGLPYGIGVHNQALELSEFIEEVLWVNDLYGEQVDIVAHSRGGIVSRLALDHFETGQRVANLVTVGTPHRGTVTARYGRGVELDELRPESDVVARLHQQLPWTGPRLVCLWSDADPLVVPPTHAQVPGAINVQLTGLSHCQLLLWPSGWRAAHAALMENPKMTTESVPTGINLEDLNQAAAAGIAAAEEKAAVRREASDLRKKKRAEDDAAKAEKAAAKKAADGLKAKANADKEAEKKAAARAKRDAERAEAKRVAAVDREAKEVARAKKAAERAEAKRLAAEKKRAQAELRAAEKARKATEREAEKALKAAEKAAEQPDDAAEGESDKKDDPKWRRRKDARPDELIAAALALFAEKGFERTSLRDVGKKAGVSKATVYLYFKNKEDLLLAAVQRSVVPILDFGDDYEIDSDAPASEMIRTLVHRWVDEFDARSASGLPRLVVTEANRFPALGELYVDAVLQRARRLFQRILKRGIREGEFAEVDVREVVHVLLAPLHYVQIHAASLGPHDPGFPDVHAFLDRHVDLFLAAIKK